MSSKRAFLIDGTALCYRAYYAIPQLNTADGAPTNAIYGVVTMLNSLLQREKPDYVAIAFDRSEPTFRHEVYGDYKSEREAMPENLQQQLEGIRDVAEAFNISVFDAPGYEGEDVLAALTKMLLANSVDVFLVTADKDLMQLVSDRVKVYNALRSDIVVYDEQAVKEKYGVFPHQMADFLALMGDKVDGIPGVPGIGKKTAAELLEQFGSLEEIYDNLDKITSVSKRRKLAENREQAELSRRLAIIDDQVSLEVNLDMLKRKAPDAERLADLYSRFQFYSLLKALDTKAAVQPKVAAHSLNWERNKTDSRKVLDQVKGHAVLSWVSCENGGVLMINAGAESNHAWRFSSGDAVDEELIVWLESPEAFKIGHDIKMIARALWPYGIRLQGIAGDTLLMAYLLHVGRNTQRISFLAERYLERRIEEPEKFSIHTIEDEALLPFVDLMEVCRELHPIMLEKLEELKMKDLYSSLELPLLAVLWQMEQNGIAVDADYLESLRVKVSKSVERLKTVIVDAAGEAFNLNSTKQLAHILFDVLGLPVFKRTKTGPSTDSEVLHRLMPYHELPGLLIEYRECAKLLSTYIEALPRLINAETRRIHTSFNQMITATGRLSSSEPNLQNIPVKTDLGRSIRKAFIPGGKNQVFVAADYSQIELRILAHYSQDAGLLKAFKEGRDIHAYTASLIYGLPENEISSEQRGAMKAVNFGILYGMTAHGLSRELGTTFKEAQDFINAYFERYPGVRGYFEAQIEHAKTHGYVQTLFGRRRAVPDIQSRNMPARQMAERVAINTPIQGTAADLIKKAMVNIVQAGVSLELASRLILQVHDELIFECPRKLTDSLVAIVKREMEQVLTLDVPLIVTVKTGKNWQDLEIIR